MFKPSPILRGIRLSTEAVDIQHAEAAIKRLEHLQCEIVKDEQGNELGHLLHIGAKSREPRHGTHYENRTLDAVEYDSDIVPEKRQYAVIAFGKYQVKSFTYPDAAKLWLVNGGIEPVVRL